jgi:hypothetical protein
MERSEPMLAWWHVKTFTAALLALCAALLITTFPPARADEKTERTDLILSQLPPADSPAYQALRDLAGNATGEALEMTRSEMWSVAKSRVEALKSAATAQGVTVKELHQGWNKMLAPMSAAAMTAAQKDMMHQAMDSKAAMGVSLMALPPADVMEYAMMKGMKAAPGEPPSTLVIPLNDTTTVTARSTSVTKTDDGYIWHGVVDGTDGLVTLMWWPSGRLTGTVNYGGHMFAVKPMGGAMHGVVEMAPSGLPPEHAPMGQQMLEKMHMKEDPLVHKGDASMLKPSADGEKSEEPGGEQPERGNTKNLEDAPLHDTPLQTAPAGVGPRSDVILPPSEPAGARKPDPITITLIVAYTKQAASHYSDIEKDLIALAVEEANQSFRNSGLGYIRLKVVHAYETDYVESGTHFEHVFRFADKGDGYMDEVHRLRDEYHADVGVLIVHDPQGCGLSAGVAPKPERAFAVVHHECAATMYSLGHEIGHIIGARHDMALDDSTQPFPFGHGFVSGTQWRTMMSYKDTCDGCPRLPIWSNPAVMVKGIPAGDDKSDNARVIAERAAVVAGFR